MSGWSSPLPLYFFERFLPPFLSFVSDSYKQWHYKLDFVKDCSEATTTYFGATVQYPSKAYFPPGTICGKDVTRQLCPTAGESGSPMLAKNSLGRFYIEGVLSFHRGCQEFTYKTAEPTRAEFLSYTASPLTFTKLSCYLPWVAEQFGLSYEDNTLKDEACMKGIGQRPPYDTKCRANPDQDLSTAKEHPCIFPFYYKGKGPYNNCTLFDQQYFDVPVWRCPIRNITTKYKDTGINHFEEDEKALSIGYCYNNTLAIATCDPEQEDGGPDCQRLVDPDADCPDFLRLPPFASCKSDCPGGNNKLFIL